MPKPKLKIQLDLNKERLVTSFLEDVLMKLNENLWNNQLPIINALSTNANTYPLVMQSDAKTALLNKIKTVGGTSETGLEDVISETLARWRIKNQYTDADCALMEELAENITPDILMLHIANKQYNRLLPEDAVNLPEPPLEEDIVKCVRYGISHYERLNEIVSFENDLDEEQFETFLANMEPVEQIPQPVNEEQTGLTTQELRRINTNINQLIAEINTLSKDIYGMEAPLEPVSQGLVNCYTKLLDLAAKEDKTEFMQEFKKEEKSFLNYLCLASILIGESRSKIEEDKSFTNFLHNAPDDKQAIHALEHALNSLPGFAEKKNALSWEKAKECLLTNDFTDLIGANNFKIYTKKESREIARIGRNLSSVAVECRFSDLKNALTSKTAAPGAAENPGRPGWTPTNVENTDNATFKQKNYTEYVTAFEGLLKRLEGTKRTFWPQNNTEGFTKMVENLNVLCNTFKTGKYLDFQSPAFYKVMTNVVNASKKYQDDHIGGIFTGKNYSSYQKIRLEVAAEAQLLTDMMLQNIKLGNKEAYKARVSLKEGFSTALMRNSTDVAKRDFLSTAVKNNMKGQPPRSAEDAEKILSSTPKQVNAMVKQRQSPVAKT